MPIEVICVYLAYMWIGLLHATLVGTCVFAWQKYKIHSSNLMYYAILIFCILFFFETYWIKVFQYFQIKVITQNNALLSYFSISSTSNIALHLKPSLITVFSCLLQTIIAVLVGKRLLKKIKIA
jgi:hypothetical protein